MFRGSFSSSSSPYSSSQCTSSSSSAYSFSSSSSSSFSSSSANSFNNILRCCESKVAHYSCFYDSSSVKRSFAKLTTTQCINCGGYLLLFLRGASLSMIVTVCRDPELTQLCLHSLPSLHTAQTSVHTAQCSNTLQHSAAQCTLSMYSDGAPPVVSCKN